MINLSIEKEYKMKKIQSGRSMIEMLGVLAIIGVLSIGGLAGYTMAMNRHRANTLLNDASLCIVKEQTKTESGLIDNATDGTASCSNVSIDGATIDVTQGGDENTVTVEFGGVSDAVLKAIGSRFGLAVANNAETLTVYDFTGNGAHTAP